MSRPVVMSDKTPGLGGGCLFIRSQESGDPRICLGTVNAGIWLVSTARDSWVRELVLGKHAYKSIYHKPKL